MLFLAPMAALAGFTKGVLIGAGCVIACRSIKHRRKQAGSSDR